MPNTILSLTVSKRGCRWLSNQHYQVARWTALRPYQLQQRWKSGCRHSYWIALVWSATVRWLSLTTSKSATNASTCSFYWTSTIVGRLGRSPTHHTTPKIPSIHFAVLCKHTSVPHACGFCDCSYVSSTSVRTFKWLLMLAPMVIVCSIITYSLCVQ